MKKFLAVLLACAALCGCAAAKDEIVISTGVNMVAGKFDPTTGFGAWGPDIFHCHLLKIGANNELVFDLATSEKISPDGLTYVYELRKDAKFADGMPLTAKDVVFTFETTKVKASAVDLSMMESVKALDDYTVEFKLSKPWSLFSYNVSYLGIATAHAYNADTYGERPLCSGAWKIIDFQKDQQLILAPNEHYYGPKSPFKRVTILKVDEDAALAVAQSGKLDFVYIESEYTNVPVKDMKLLSIDVLGSLAVNLPVIPEGTAPNGNKVGNNVTCDPAIRKALNIGINRAELVERALNGRGTPSYSIGGDTLPWTARIAFDDNRVEEAKKLLDDAGWKVGPDGVRVKNGVRAEFTVTGRSNDNARYNTVVALADNVKALGIKINAKSAPWADARKIARSTPTCWIFGAPSPSDFYLYFHSDNINRATIGNPPSYGNPKVDELIDRALAETDHAVANQCWQQAEALTAEDVPFLFISHPQNNYLVREGLVIPPLGHVPVKNQGLSIMENLNLWSWAD